MRPPRLIAALLAVATWLPAGTIRAADEYPLEKLPVLSRVLVSINDAYGDPERIDPRRMIVGALVRLEQTFPEIRVQGDERAPTLTLSVRTERLPLDLSGVDSIWKVRAPLQEAVTFVHRHLPSAEGARRIEYECIHGLLATLDPRTVFIEPAAFREMKASSGRSAPGGIGLVVAMRQGDLTIVKLVADSPARRAGLRRGEIVAEIDGRSTVNMDLQEAVDRLRGPVGSTVSLGVIRAGASAPTRVDVVREVLSAVSVPSAALLDGKIAYVKLSQLNRKASADLAAAIAAQAARAGGALRGLVLDLRGNQGGLLDQAVEVSDLFLSSGVIARFEGGRKQRIREVREATAEAGDFVGVPLVVLVNHDTASGAEIIAAALQQNGRAVVLGRPTLGNFDIHVLHAFDAPEKEGECALKLKIARFATPSGTTTDGGGLAPDVTLRPGRVTKDDVRWFAPPIGARTALELQYLLDPPETGIPERRASGAPRAPLPTPVEQEDEDAAGDPDPVVEDAPIRFARALLDRAPGAERARLLEVAKALVGERRGEEDAKVLKRLGELGLDWSAGGADAAGAAVTVTPAPERDHRAGETVAWTIAVANRGTAPIRRLRAWTVAPSQPVLDGRELVFGTISPGKRRSWTVPVRIPRGSDSRRDEVTLHFEDEGRSAPADVVTTFGVLEAPRPLFDFSVRIEPDGRTADGVERRAVRVEVRNVGAGPSGERTYVSMKNLGPDGPFIAKSRHVVGALAPGMTANAVIPIELRRATASPELPMQVRIVDEELEELVAERIVWKVGASDAAPAWRFAAPRLALTPDPAQGPTPVKGDTLRLRGTATLPRAAVAPAPRLRNVLVLVNERKVLYAEPEAGSDGSSIAFEADLPLVPGTNRVSVFAREGDELQSRRSFVIQRRPPGQRGAP